MEQGVTAKADHRECLGVGQSFQSLNINMFCLSWSSGHSFLFLSVNQPIPNGFRKAAKQVLSHVPGF